MVMTWASSACCWPHPQSSARLRSCRRTVTIRVLGSEVPPFLEVDCKALKLNEVRVCPAWWSCCAACSMGRAHEPVVHVRAPRAVHPGARRAPAAIRPAGAQPTAAYPRHRGALHHAHWHRMRSARSPWSGV